MKRTLASFFVLSTIIGTSLGIILSLREAANPAPILRGETGAMGPSGPMGPPGSRALSRGEIVRTLLFGSID